HYETNTHSFHTERTIWACPHKSPCRPPRQRQARRVLPARPQRDPRTTQSHGRSAPYRIRRLLTKADERLEDSDARLLGLSRAGDSRGEVATTRHAKEAVRELYAHGDESTRREWI